MSRKFTEEEKVDIISKYLNGSRGCDTIAKEYCCDKQLIQRLLKKSGVKLNKTSRQYSVDEKYFDVIDTESKAYFLGLMYADGYLIRNNKSFGIGLQECDKHILEEFLTELKSDHRLTFRNRKEKNPNHQNCFVITIRNEHMCKRLVELGCLYDKSLILKFPTEEQVPRHLLRHFIRGYFDGDGSFWTFFDNRESMMYAVCIVSTVMFCEKLQQVLSDTLNIKSHLRERDKQVRKTTRYLNIRGGKQVFKFLEWMYEDSKVSLKRKREKYLRIKKYRSLSCDDRYRLILDGIEGVNKHKSLKLSNEASVRLTRNTNKRSPNEETADIHLQTPS